MRPRSKARSCEPQGGRGLGPGARGVRRSRTGEGVMLDQVKALTFDVFGTVVDWRGSITREGEALGRAKNVRGVDWAKFADSWRALYQPAIQEIRSGRRPFTKLDDLHRANLDRVLGDFSITGLSEPEIDHLN